MNLLKGELFHHDSAFCLSDLDVNTLSKNLLRSLDLSNPSFLYKALLDEPLIISSSKLTLVEGLFLMFVSLASASVLEGVCAAVTGLVLVCFLGITFGASLSTLALVVGCD